jgi:hypothetical protein
MVGGSRPARPVDAELATDRLERGQTVAGDPKLAYAARVAVTLRRGFPRDGATHKESDMEKCAHPACQCMVDKKGPHGKYCSDHCRKAGDVTELRCGCRHPECQ